MIFHCLKSGLARMWANKRIVAIFYAANLIFGVLIMLPLRAALEQFAGFSKMAGEIAGPLNIDFLFEFLKYNEIVRSSIFIFALVVPLVYWTVNLFLSGGAFAIFATGQPYSPNLFWGNAASYFGRFVRLFILSIPLFLILFCLQFLESAIERLFFGSDPYEYVTYWGDWIQFGLRWMSLLLFGMIFDYARIYMVLSDELSSSVSLWRGMQFVVRKIKLTIGLTIILFLSGILILVFYSLLSKILTAPGVAVVIALFLLQQIYLFFRMMLRLTFYASELHLYESLTTQNQPTVISDSGDLGIERISPELLT